MTETFRVYCSINVKKINRFYFYIIIVVVILIILITYKDYSYQDHTQSLSRYIPKIIIKDAITHLKSNCDCKVQTVQLKDYQNFYEIKIDNIKKYELSKSKFNLGAITCDLYNVLRRGPNQKIISYSLYGINEFYYDRLKILIKQAKELYPEWIIRIHYDNSINLNVICELECFKNNETNEYFNNVDFCDMNRLPYGSQIGTWNANYINKMIWRWLPMGDPFVDYFSSRDTDSPLSQREVDAVDEWINSNKIFHIMRDNPSHWAYFVGCCWGYANKIDRQLSNKLFSLMTNKEIAKKYNEQKRGPDQAFLVDYFWKYAKKSSMIHDSYLCRQLGGIAFPTRRKGFCYVGCIGDCCDEQNSTKNILPECPYICRPDKYKDWNYC